MASTPLAYAQHVCTTYPSFLKTVILELVFVGLAGFPGRLIPEDELKTRVASL